MARYLITGGAGFIGSHLADSLIADGHSVRVLDNLFSGRIDNLPAQAELITADVIKQDAVRDALDGVDGCFHLAAIASIEYCRQEWLRSHTVNLSGTITVFDEVSRIQSRRGRPLPVVYASSAAVYGDPTDTPIAEQAPTRPANAYGVDKLGCEMHAAVASRAHDLAAVGLRFFNIYGPRQDPKSPYSGVVSVFCRRILQRAPIEIYGDGMQVRDFVYIDDAVRALRCAMGAAGRAPQVFNVCTGIGTTVGQLGAAIADLQKVPFLPRYAPSRVGDVRVSVGDPRLARDKLGFGTATPLRQGLERTLASMLPPANDREATDRWKLSTGG